MPTRLRSTAAIAIVVAGLAACAGGFVAQRMWTQLAWNRFGESLLLAAISLVIAGALRRWRGCSWAAALALVWLSALVFFTGVLPALAACLLGAAAIALGSLLLPADIPARAVLALCVGLVLIAGVAGWMLPLPIHRGSVYWPLLAGICVWRARALRAIARDTAHGFEEAVAAEPHAAAFATLLLGLASVGAWLPTMQADDLAYHLSLPSQLQANGLYAFAPTQQIWALAPWLGDVVQGIAQVLAGREARGAIDALWMLASAALLCRLTAALGGSMRLRWHAVAVFASLPLLAMLVGGMQTELPATALVVALACVIVCAREAGESLLLAAAVLAAGLVALKLGHAIAAGVLLVWALARMRGRVEIARGALALLLFFVLAGSSYFYAWHVSSNPLLPLFNDVFHSPLLAPVQLADLRWHAGLSLALPWSITFDTRRYLEAWDGGFGFVLVALAGAWMLAVVRVDTRGIALVASAVFLLPLLPMQYARYAFPGLVLLLPPMLIAADAALGARDLGRVVVALCVLNLAFQANANWLLHVSTVRKLVGSGGRVDVVYRHYAPERALIAELRRRDASDSVVLALDAQAPFIAELGNRGRTVAHYAPALEEARIEADGDASGERWQALIRSIDAHWLLLRPARLNAALRAGLARDGAQRVIAIGDAELWASGERTPLAAGTQP